MKQYNTLQMLMIFIYTLDTAHLQQALAHIPKTHVQQLNNTSSLEWQFFTITTPQPLQMHSAYQVDFGTSGIPWSVIPVNVDLLKRNIERPSVLHS